MKKELKYWFLLGLAAIVFLLVELLTPEPLNWKVTYSPQDKNPYGGYVLGDLLPGIFPDSEITNTNKTFYEMKDEINNEKNVLIIAGSFNPDDVDTEFLLEKVSQGTHAFISANKFAGLFADTLNLNTRDYFFSENIIENLNREDTAGLRIVNPWLEGHEPFYYQRNNVPYYFYSFDSVRTTVIAYNDLDLPVSLKVEWGEGFFILNSTPLTFTNNYLLYENNNDFAEANLSFLPEKDVIRTEYYHLGRAEASTPLRFILTNPPLEWAYYLTVISLVIFIIFEAKRKQRKIPIIKPLANTTLEFVKTLGNLYFRKGNHKDIAQKNILFFREKIYSTYNLRVSEDEDFVSLLANKSSSTKEEVHDLFNYFEIIRSKDSVSDHELLDLNKKIEKIENGK